MGKTNKKPRKIRSNEFYDTSFFCIFLEITIVQQINRNIKGSRYRIRLPLTGIQIFTFLSLFFFFFLILDMIQLFNVLNFNPITVTCINQTLFRIVFRM